MSEREAWIIDGVRTPRGKGRKNGALHHIHPQELLAQCLNAVVERTGVPTTDIEDVIAGNASGVGDHGADIARLAVLSAGWPFATPGLTINRFCGSGQQAVGMAATGVLSGHQDLVIGGGVESMSRPFTPATTARPRTMDGDNPLVREKYPLIPQGISADLIATVEGFSRTECDELAVDQPGPRRQGHRRRALRPQRHPRPQPGRLRGPRPRGVPAARHDAGGPRPAGPELRRDGRPPLRQVRRDVRRDVPADVPADRRRRPRPPRRQLLRRRRRGVGDPRRLVGLRPGQRPHAAGPHPHDRRRRLRAGDHAHRPRHRPPSAASPRPA